MKSMDAKLVITHFLIYFALFRCQGNAVPTPGKAGLAAAAGAGAGAAGGTTFDITKYGAAKGACVSKALLDAWKGACESPTAATVVVPAGIWTLSQVKLVGPCKAPIHFQIQGTLQANPDPSALPNKEGEWITINYVDDLTLFGGGVLDGQGQVAWKGNDCHTNKKCAKLPYNLSLNSLKNVMIKDLTTKDSKNFHVNCMSSSNVTFQRFTISAPADDIAPNTDGLHIARSKNVQVLDSIIKTGDDCVSIGDETDQLQIKNVTCGPGHGISIGSLGKFATEKDVKGVYVQNCKFIGTQNGARIKTWPSAPATLSISDIRFEDLTMENVANPIMIDQEYCPHNLCDKSKPSLIQISKLSIKNIKGSSSTAEVIILSCSSGKPCKDVEIGNIELTYTGKEGPITTICNNVKPTFVGKQNPPICAEKPAAGKKTEL